MGYDIDLMLAWMEDAFDDLPPQMPEPMVLHSIERYYPHGLRGFVLDHKPQYSNN